MRNTGILTIIILLFAVTCNISSAQNLNIQKDTVSVKEKKEQKADLKEKNNNSENVSASGGGKDNANNKKVKEVKSAKPDMSKVKGARPPSVVRPSGSRIPKGVGKAKGAGKRNGG